MEPVNLARKAQREKSCASPQVDHPLTLNDSRVEDTRSSAFQPWHDDPRKNEPFNGEQQFLEKAENFFEPFFKSPGNPDDLLLQEVSPMLPVPPTTHQGYVPTPFDWLPYYYHQLNLKMSQAASESYLYSQINHKPQLQKEKRKKVKHQYIIKEEPQDSNSRFSGFKTLQKPKIKVTRKRQKPPTTFSKRNLLKKDQDLKLSKHWNPIIPYLLPLDKDWGADKFCDYLVVLGRWIDLRFGSYLRIQDTF